jgi:uncharacterized protein (TIGR03437 family)
LNRQSLPCSWSQGTRQTTTGLDDSSKTARQAAGDQEQAEGVTGPGIAQPVQLPIAFVEDDQINAQAPEFIGTGPVMLTVILNPSNPNQLVSDMATLNSQKAFAPALFFIPNSTTIDAVQLRTWAIVSEDAVLPLEETARRILSQEENSSHI